MTTVVRADARRADLRGLVWFYVLATAVTWACYVPVVLAQNGTIHLDLDIQGLLGLTAILAPTFTACLLAALRGGSRELRGLLGMAVRVRFRPRWYLLALGVPFAVPLTAVALDALLSGTAPAAWLIAPTAQTLATFWIAAIGEDLGWRGYALARALDRWGPATACTIHGVLWGLWHLPMFFRPGTAQADQEFWLFTLQVIGATMIFARLFTATGGSVFAMMLMHAAANLAFNTVPVFATEGGNPVRTTLVSVLYLAAGLVAIATMPRRTWPRRTARRTARAAADRAAA